jgi:hypothetical protein
MVDYLTFKKNLNYNIFLKNKILDTIVVLIEMDKNCTNKNHGFCKLFV